jgi:hypothetical protein
MNIHTRSKARDISSNLAAPLQLFATPAAQAAKLLKRKRILDQPKEILDLSKRVRCVFKPSKDSMAPPASACLDNPCYSRIDRSKVFDELSHSRDELDELMKSTLADKK